MAELDLTQHFMGSATVGERGQVVIPISARERLDIKPGDKLLVFIHPSGWGVDFVKFDKLQEAQQELERVLQQMDELHTHEDAQEAEEDEA